jgi:hypothetical protein
MLAFLLAMSLGLAAKSQEPTRAITLLTGHGRVCDNGSGFAWVNERKQVLRWDYNESAPTRVELPQLVPPALSRAIVGCVKREDDFELYYTEDVALPGTRSDSGGPAISRRTLWRSTKQYRLLDETVSGGGDFLIAGNFLLPAAGAVVRTDFTIERMTDGLRRPLAVPQQATLVYATSMPAPSGTEPADVAICFTAPRAQGASLICQAVHVGANGIETWPLELPTRDATTILDGRRYAPANLAFRCAASIGGERSVNRPDKIAFDCRPPLLPFAPSTQYPTSSGYVVWRGLAKTPYCRQRYRGAEALLVEAQCFRLGDGSSTSKSLLEALLAAPISDGSEAVSTEGWRLSVLGRESALPSVDRLVPE